MFVNIWCILIIMNSGIVAGDQMFMNILNYVLSPIYKFMVAIALLYFFWGIFAFVRDLNDPDKKNNGKEHLLWGTIGLFIILSVGGIVPIFNNIVGGIFAY